MCTTLAALAIGTQVAGGIYSANAQNQTGIAMNNYYKSQADQSQKLGALALAQGERQSNLVQDQAAQEGKQLKIGQAEFNAKTAAALAANGVQGQTATDIVNNNANKQALDESLLRYNADVKSYQAKTKGIYDNYADQVQAGNYRFEGNAAKYSGKTNAFSTLLGTATSVASTALSIPKSPTTTFSPGSFSNVTYKTPKLNLLR